MDKYGNTCTHIQGTAVSPHCKHDALPAALQYPMANRRSLHGGDPDAPRDTNTMWTRQYLKTPADGTTTMTTLLHTHTQRTATPTKLSVQAQYWVAALLVWPETGRVGKTMPWARCLSKTRARARARMHAHTCTLARRHTHTQSEGTSRPPHGPQNIPTPVSAIVVAWPTRWRVPQHNHRIAHGARA